MGMITSVQNTKIKWVRSIQANSRLRKSEGVFVVEGVRLVEEALAGGWEARLVLYAADLSPRGRQVLEGFAAGGVPLEEVSPQVMRQSSDTDTPQGLLAVLAQRALPLPESLDFVFIPDAVRDPGNLGTMLRTASAAGVQAVLLPPGSVDAFSPKVLRAGMGAHFRLPVLNLSWKQIEAALEPLTVYLAAAGGGDLLESDFCPPLALIIGRSRGCRPQAWRLAEKCVCIPMPGGGNRSMQRGRSGADV
jgi:TrmH family RNA methyltransferase